MNLLTVCELQSHSEQGWTHPSAVWVQQFHFTMCNITHLCLILSMDYLSITAAAWFPVLAVQIVYPFIASSFYSQSYNFHR